MTGGTARQYRCDACGKESIEDSRTWQAHVLIMPRGGRPRLYELCKDCGAKINNILEGGE